MVQRIAKITAIGTIGYARVAFACSGPLADEAIARAERLGWLLWGSCAATLLAFGPDAQTLADRITNTQVVTLARGRASRVFRALDFALAMAIVLAGMLAVMHDGPRT
jgi:hypothetical protein